MAETTLTTSNVNLLQFGKLFERVVDDEIYGQPLYVPNLFIGGVAATQTFGAAHRYLAQLVAFKHR